MPSQKGALPSSECSSFGSALRAVLERLQHRVEAKAADFLTRREFFERHQELPDVLLCRYEQEKAVCPPAPVFPAVLGLLERVGAESRLDAADAAWRRLSAEAARTLPPACSAPLPSRGKSWSRRSSRARRSTSLRGCSRAMSIADATTSYPAIRQRLSMRLSSFCPPLHPPSPWRRRRRSLGAGCLK